MCVHVSTPRISIHVNLLLSASIIAIDGVALIRIITGIMNIDSSKGVFVASKIF